MSEPLSLWSKIATIAGDLGALKKDGRYDGGQRGGSYNFISQAQLVAELRHEMKQHLITIEPSMLSAETENIVKTSQWDGKVIEKTSRRVVVKMAFRVVNGEDPSQVIEATWFGEAIDAGDKGTQKAATSAEKYYLLKLFKVSDQEDPDAENGHDDETERPRMGTVVQMTPAPIAEGAQPSPAAESTQGEAATRSQPPRKPRFEGGNGMRELSDVEEQLLRAWANSLRPGLFAELEGKAAKTYPLSANGRLQVRHYVTILKAAESIEAGKVAS